MIWQRLKIESIMKFEWDKLKSEINQRKHGVSFQEASTVFADLLAISFDDPDHSVNESRFLIFGLSKFDRLLTVSFTEREDVVRIISARETTKTERKIYENG
jgi:uncharacterized DUF497 family protein